MSVYDPVFEALKVYGNYLIDKETTAKMVLLTQDPTESDFVKGFNRGEHAATKDAYTAFKLMLEGLTRA